MKSKIYSYGRQNITWNDIIEVVKTLRSPYLTQGPKIAEFEKTIADYVGAKYCVAVANGTAALHLCTLALELKKGDEGITTPNTFLASANCLQYVGATAKFADINAKDACIDVKEIEKHITDKTKCLIPVHFAGISCDMEKISKLAKKHNLFVIEDAAHAIGSDYRNEKIGSCAYSDMTIFSFHPVKTITTAEGGAITTNSKELYEKLLYLRSHGIDKRTPDSWIYEMNHLGFNYRITDMQAALGISQLKRIETFKDKRREIFKAYQDAFADDERFSTLVEPTYSKACFHLCPLLINFKKVKISKDELFKALKDKGLFLQVHYIPVHTQPYYKKLGFKQGDFPKAEAYYEKALSLPIYPDLKTKDIETIVKIIKETAI